MLREKLVVPALVILLASGCDNTPSSSDIDMGPAAEQAPAQDPGPSAVDGAAARAPELIPPGEGEINSVIESCNVEQVNGMAFSGSPVSVARDAPMTISGWVVGESPSAPVELRLVNDADASTYRVEIVTDVARDDVAEAFDADPAVVKPGFNATVDIGSLPSGDYHIQVVAPTGAGAAVCDNGRVLSLAD